MVNDTKVAKMSLSEEILNMNDETTELVKVPEWGNKEILCKNLSGADRAVLSSMLEVDAQTNKVKTTSTSADIVILGAYDPENGSRIFAKSQKALLLGKNSAPLERLAAVIQRLSGLTQEGLDNAEKN
jgi:hypothetical protein